MVGRPRSARLRRSLVGLVALLALYGLAAEIGHGRLPTRVWLVSHYVDDVELLPTYPSLAEEAVFLVRSGILGGGLLVTTARTLAGLALGALLGLSVGLLTGARARAEYAMEPWVALVRFTPALALLPLYVLWFGYGEASKILLVATAAAIVTLEGSFQGVRRIPRGYLDAAAALGAPATLTFRAVLLPAALPAILASLRIAVTLAWVTVVVAELIRPTMPSMGYLLALAGAYPRVPTIVVALAAMALLVLASDELVLAGYRRGTRWVRRRSG